MQQADPCDRFEQADSIETFPGRTSGLQHHCLCELEGWSPERRVPPVCMFEGSIVDVWTSGFSTSLATGACRSCWKGLRRARLIIVHSPVQHQGVPITHLERSSLRVSRITRMTGVQRRRGHRDPVEYCCRCRLFAGRDRVKTVQQHNFSHVRLGLHINDSRCTVRRTLEVSTVNQHRGAGRAVPRHLAARISEGACPNNFLEEGRPTRSFPRGPIFLSLMQ